VNISESIINTLKATSGISLSRLFLISVMLTEDRVSFREWSDTLIHLAAIGQIETNNGLYTLVTDAERAHEGLRSLGLD
jgi:hypothetical protein